MSDLLVEFTIYILPKSANKEPTKYTEKSDQIFLQSIIYFFCVWCSLLESLVHLSQCIALFEQVLQLEWFRGKEGSPIGIKPLRLEVVSRHCLRVFQRPDWDLGGRANGTTLHGEDPWVIYTTGWVIFNPARVKKSFVTTGNLANGGITWR